MFGADQRKGCVELFYYAWRAGYISRKFPWSPSIELEFDFGSTISFDKGAKIFRMKSAAKVVAAKYIRSIYVTRSTNQCLALDRCAPPDSINSSLPNCVCAFALWMREHGTARVTERQAPARGDASHFDRGSIYMLCCV